MPPMPGQSRSLLQFNPTIKEEFNVKDNGVNVDTKTPIMDIIKQVKAHFFISKKLILESNVKRNYYKT